MIVESFLDLRVDIKAVVDILPPLHLLQLQHLIKYISLQAPQEHLGT
jgi:hypothetical protein